MVHSKVRLPSEKAMMKKKKLLQQDSSRTTEKASDDYSDSVTISHALRCSITTNNGVAATFELEMQSFTKCSPNSGIQF